MNRRMFVGAVTALLAAPRRVLGVETGNRNTTWTPAPRTRHRFLYRHSRHGKLGSVFLGVSDGQYEMRVSVRTGFRSPLPPDPDSTWVASDDGRLWEERYGVRGLSVRYASESEYLANIDRDSKIAMREVHLLVEGEATTMQSFTDDTPLPQVHRNDTPVVVTSAEWRSMARRSRTGAAGLCSEG